MRAGARAYHRRKVTGVAQRRREKSIEIRSSFRLIKGFPAREHFLPTRLLSFFSVFGASYRIIEASGKWWVFSSLPSSLSGDLNLGHLSLNACTSFLRPLFYPTCHSTLACTERGGTNLRISLLVPLPRLLGLRYANFPRRRPHGILFTAICKEEKKIFAERKGGSFDNQFVAPDSARPRRRGHGEGGQHRVLRPRVQLHRRRRPLHRFGALSL